MSDVVIPTHLPRFNNLLGLRFTRLVVTGYRGMNESKRRRHLWECQCDCGQVVKATTQCLQAGESKSCGCLTREINIQKGTTHGMSKSKEYKSWAGARQRVLNENTPDYSAYRGRGIAMCQEWLDSFEAFFRDMGKMPQEGMSLERINNDGNYEKSNCKWETKIGQASNTRRNKKLAFENELLTLSEIARRTGIKRATLDGRIRRGMTLEEALK